MARANLLQLWWPLFIIPTVFGSNARTTSELTTILILLFVFLLLLIVLIFSWHRLNLDTDNKYHPRRLCCGGSDDEDGRGPLASLAGDVADRWRTIRNRVMGSSSAQLSQSEDGMEQEPAGHPEDEDMESNEEYDDHHDRTSDLGDETDANDDDYSSMEIAQPRAKKEMDASDPPAERRSTNSQTVDTLQVLLPNFSGSAAWEDEGPEGSVSVHVTAL
ncbi:uncharacterized protein [Pleurodeles waltl]|uniref:uncharacterized protein n=1 Tax=Pleurodeles waltl TaxID=8319 RepID=UPI003709ADF6